MAQLQKAQGQIELKCDADKFFNVWALNTNLVSEMCPNKITKIELHEGTSWHSLGAVTTWHYIADGENENLKAKVAEIDEDNKSVRYTYIDGHILKNYYKSFKGKFETIPKEGQGCLVKWSFEYEKWISDAPNVEIYIDFLLGCSKDMDARICRA